MKELTIEEKAKLYDKALEKARQLCAYPTSKPFISDLQDLFPELKESEDERIRKEIITHCRNTRCVTEESAERIAKWIAWLEKQGKQKPTLPKWKYKNDNTPLLRDSLILNKYGCVAKSPSGAFVNDVWVIDYDELAKLPKEELEKQGEQETLCDKCRKEHPSHSCQDITELGRYSVEHGQKSDNSYCQENCKGFQETGKCFADGDCKAKREAESNDKNEPKFHEGDWVIYNNDICQIVKREEGCNILVTQFGVEKEPVNERNLSTAKLWDISDAKDDDVLVFDDIIMIFKNIKTACTANTYILYCDGIVVNDWCDFGHNATPATKEQRDFLFQKMKKAEYIFDFKNKELKKIKNDIEIPFGAKDSELQEATYYIPKGFHAEIDDDFVIIKKGEPTTWNKEDEELVKWSINNLTELKDRFGEEYGKVGKCIDWLKSLKQRIGG